MKNDSDYLTESIAEIKQLVTGLIVLNRSLRERLSKIEEENTLQTKRLEKKNAECQILAEENEVLKFVKTIGVDGNNQAKEGVENLMREIAECIDLVKKMQ